MEVCSTSFAHISNELRYALGVINLLVGLAALIGNVMAFLVIFKTKYFRNRSTCFLGSLIMTDFLVGAILEPMHVAQFFSEALRNNCKFNTARRYLSTLLIGASISSIAIISYDRYTHLSRTQQYLKHMCIKKVVALISISWVIPMIVPILMKLGKDEKIYSGIIFVLISIYFTIIVICYVFIVKIVRKKKSEEDESGNQSSKRKRRTKNDIRAAKAIGIIIVCFCLTLIPVSIYHCIVAVKAFMPNSIPDFKESSRDVFYACAMTLAMVNSGINPLIYYFRNPKFKESLLQVMKKSSPLIIFFRNKTQISSKGGVEADTVSSSV